MTLDEKTTLWLGRLKSGDPAAAGKLWEGYYRRLVGLARKKLGDLPRGAADESDVAQSAMKSFFRGVEQGRFPRLEDSDDLWRLLVVITVRKAADLREYAGRAIRDWRRLVEADGSGLSLMAGLASAEPDPALAAEVNEQCEVLLAALPDESWRQVARRKLAGYTEKEIADELECSLAGVQRKLRFIREAWLGR
jgi:RNA polymerase sigma factor (sigma-70 family)